jgi:hypothetical protein
MSGASNRPSGASDSDMNGPLGSGARRYSVFGLQIDSDLELPELFETTANSLADVRIELGKVPSEGQFEAGLHIVGGGALLVVEKTARYFVAAGSRMVVEPVDGAASQNVRLFLLGSALGLLLHQRRMLPLHANAVELDGAAIAFMGASGAGKSTLAAWFSDRGFPLIADDVAVVDFEGDTPIIQPGLPRLRLWERVIEATGRDPSDYPLSVEGDAAYDKRDVLLPQAKVASDARRLHAIIEISRTGPPIEPLRGAAAAEAIMSHTYRGEYVKALRTVHAHWLMCMKLVAAVPVFRASVDFDLQQLDWSYEPLLLEVRKLFQGPAR